MWNIPGVVHAKHRFMLCAVTSIDCLNPCFAPNIYNSRKLVSLVLPVFSENSFIRRVQLCLMQKGTATKIIIPLQVYNYLKFFCSNLKLIYCFCLELYLC